MIFLKNEHVLWVFEREILLYKDNKQRKYVYIRIYNMRFYRSNVYNNYDHRVFIYFSICVTIKWRPAVFWPEVDCNVLTGIPNLPTVQFIPQETSICRQKDVILNCVLIGSYCSNSNPREAVERICLLLVFDVYLLPSFHNNIHLINTNTMFRNVRYSRRVAVCILYDIFTVHRRWTRRDTFDIQNRIKCVKLMSWSLYKVPETCFFFQIYACIRYAAEEISRRSKKPKYDTWRYEIFK